MNDYHTSPLAHIADSLLQKIETLEKTYPNGASDSVEKAHALKLLHLVKTIVATFHKHILPTFDKRNKPGTWQILGMLKSIFSNFRHLDYTLLHTRKYALFLEIKAVLPDLIKKVARLPSPVTTNLLSLLDLKKNSLFKSAATVPGPALEELYINIKDLIATVNFDAIVAIKPLDNWSVVAWLESQLFPKTADKITFSITHPMTIELVEHILHLLHEAPGSLAELLPFLNPDALNVDLHTGVTGKAMHAFFDSTYLLRHVPASELGVGAGTSSYMYQLTMHYKHIHTVTRYDGNEYYRHYLDFIQTLIQSKLPQNPRNLQSPSAAAVELSSMVTAEFLPTRASTDAIPMPEKEIIDQSPMILITPDNQSIDAMETSSEVSSIALEESMDTISAFDEEESALILRTEAARTQFVTEHISPKLAAYLDNRNEIYNLKDTFTSQDKDDRLLFLMELQTHLSNYQQTGDSSVIFNHIQNNIKRFPGKHLQALLYKISATLMDFESQQTYSPDSVEITQALVLFQEKNPKQHQALMDLYQSLVTMKQYGEQLLIDENNVGTVMATLAEQLQHDLNGFVLKHVQCSPSDQEYACFKEKFIARLHSEDAIMNQHSTLWKPIVVNVLIGLTTLGIALGVQLLYSKLYHGHCRFFCDTTDKHQYIATVDESMQTFIVKNNI